MPLCIHAKQQQVSLVDFFNSLVDASVGVGSFVERIYIRFFDVFPVGPLLDALLIVVIALAFILVR